jgi:hypothetical protein
MATETAQLRTSNAAPPMITGRAGSRLRTAVYELRILNYTMTSLYQIYGSESKICVNFLKYITQKMPPNNSH